MLKPYYLQILFVDTPLKAYLSLNSGSEWGKFWVEEGSIWQSADICKGTE